MIKVYAVAQMDKGCTVRYTTPRSRFKFNYRGMIFDTTEDITEAKHYETKGKANTAMRTFAQRMAGRIENGKKEVERLEAEEKASGECKDGYWLKTAKEQLKAMQNFVASYTFSVWKHEIDDIEESNTHKVEKKRLKWTCDYGKNEYKNRGFSIVTETTSRHYCKVCGLKLKNIPQVQIGGFFGGVICAKCATNIGKEAEQAWNSMPDVEAIDKEIFLHSI